MTEQTSESKSHPPNSKNKTTTMEIGIDSNMHPIYPHNNDHSGLVLIATKLTGTDNYNSCKRSLEIALSAKNKFTIMDGSFPVPENEDPIFPLWAKANDMVISWFFNVVTEEISNSLKYVITANSVWKELGERFANIDGHMVFQLEKELHRLEQGTGSVEFYYHKMKGYWYEASTLDPITACKCPCNCGSTRVQESREQRKQLMQLLMGLHDSYMNIRGQILRLKPLPTIREAYYMISQEESPH